MAQKAVSHKLAILLGALSVAILAWSFSSVWYHVTMHNETEVVWSQLVALDHGEVQSGESTYYLYPLDSFSQIERLASEMRALIGFGVIVTLCFIASCLIEKKWISIVVGAAAAITGLFALVWFAWSIPEAMNSNLRNLPFHQISESLDGFSGSFDDGAAGRIVYGPSAGWYLTVFAVCCQVAAIVLLLCSSRIDEYLCRRNKTHSPWTSED